MLLMLENQKALLPSKRAQLQATCDNHRAEAAIARLDLDRCTIRAPFAGLVAEKLIEIGERVQEGSTLLSLLDPARIEVPVELPASVRSRVAIGAACELTMPSMPGVSWQGQVKRIAPAANEATRTFELFVEVNNTEQVHELVPGFFVRAEIEGPTLTDVLVVPRGSVQQSKVFLYRNGQARKRGVQVARVLRDRSVVTGIRSGDVVIISNLDALYEGAPVRLEGVPAPGEDRAAPAPASQPAVADRRIEPLTNQR
jgi:RND family efflux transporter MFP subunit